jgi:enoyl-CoA hydratase
MDTDKIVLRKEGAIARIILNNPARLNAIAIEMWQALETVLDDVAEDPGTRVVVITGAGGKAFSAGADISEFDRRHADAEAVRDATARDSRVCSKLEGLAKPTIAEIEGYCLGGAVAFALCCDLRICSEGSRFGIPPAKLGHCYEPHSIERVIQAVGVPNTREILFTARQFSAQEAYEMGFVKRVVSDRELALYVQNYAETIATNAPLTVRAVKRITNELVKEPGERDMALCDALVAECYASRGPPRRPARLHGKAQTGVHGSVRLQHALGAQRLDLVFADPEAGEDLGIVLAELGDDAADARC